MRQAIDKREYILKHHINLEYRTLQTKTRLEAAQMK